jgi:predicted RNase H-like nuclease (RuvC/YqgF family)
MAEQKKEIENREITIRAIQRNFEQLSGMCQADKEQIQALQKKLADAEKRAADEETRKRAAKYPQLKEAFDNLNDKYVPRRMPRFRCPP